MKPLRETHGPVFELTRHFLARSFDSELFAKPGQWRSVATGCLAMLLTTRLALTAMLSPHSPLQAAHQAGSGDVFAEAAPMVLLSCICGLIAMIEWQMLLPSRGDYLALAGLPIHPRQVFLARFAGFTIFTVIIVAALNGLPALLSPAPAASGAAWVMACAFPIFAMVALQGALLNLLPGRWYARVTPVVQGVLSCGLLLGVLGSFHISAWAPDGGTLLRRFAWAPPIWFSGLERALRGSADPFDRTLAQRAVIGFAASVAAALLAYLASYRRYRTLLVESPEIAAARAERGWSVLDVLGRNPRQTAVLQFMAKTMTRSRTHRIALLAYVGVAAGALINSLLVQEIAARGRANAAYLLKFVVYFWPVVASMILIPGLRHVFRLPAELRANWLFRITESQGRAEWMAAVERAIIVFAIIPIYLVDAPGAVAALGWSLALRVITLQILISMTIFEGLFYSWQQLPFACSYAPGERPVMTIGGKYLAAIFIAAPPLAVLTAVYSQIPLMFAIVAIAFAALWLRLRHMRRQGWGESRLIYEDDPQAPLNLGLRS